MVGLSATTGEFVHCNMEGCGLFVGQTLAIEDRRDIDSEELRQSGMEKSGDLRERLVLLLHLEFADESVGGPDAEDCHKVPDSMKEVSCGNVAVWIKKSAVTKMSFVFPIDLTQDGSCECQGIHNAHCLRSRKTASGPRAINDNVFDPFWSPCDCPKDPQCKSFGRESHSKRIWHGLSTVKALTANAMSGKGGWEVRSEHMHMQGSNLELHKHLSWSLSERSSVELIKSNFSCKRARKILNSDLSLSTKKLQSKVKLIRLLDPLEMEACRQVLGSDCAIDFPTAAPTMKTINEDPPAQDAVDLQDLDQCRIVTCSTAKDVNPKLDKVACPPVTRSAASIIDLEDVEDRDQHIQCRKAQKRLCPCAGMDTSFEATTNGLTDSHIALRCKNLPGKSEEVMAIKSLGKRKQTNPGGVIRSVQLKDAFKCQGIDGEWTG